MNPYLKSNPGNTNPPYDDATINKFNAASSSALGYLQNRLNDPIYYKRLQNETTQSNKLGNVIYDPKTGALDLLNQRKKGLNEVKFINPNTTDQSEIAIINEIKNKGYLGAFTTGQTGRYEPEYQKDGFMKGALKQDIAGFQKNVIGINPVMFNQDYEKYLENLFIHEGEHSTQPAYPGYTNPYYNVGMMNVDNGTLPLYRNKSNITPYATNVIKENILSDDDYYSDPMEVVASKRQVEHLFEKAPEGTFKKSWKYGDDIQDEHFNYFLKGNNNTETEILKKALLGDRTIDELSEEEKKDLKVRFSNIMTKIAYNENNNDNIYTARFGTKVKEKKANPYLKKYGPGGETDNPYDPTTSYIKPKKVTIDGRNISTYSNEYRDLYNSGTLMPVDSDGIPSMYGPEVEVTAKMTDKEREKRRVAAQGPVADAVRKGTGSFARPILDTGLELSGAAGAYRFSKDPLKNLEGVANILSYTNVPGLIGHGIDYAMGKPFFDVTEEDWQGLANTLDVAGLATLGAGTAFKMAPKAMSSIPGMLGKIPDVNPNMGLRFVDKSLDASKALQRQRHGNTIYLIREPKRPLKSIDGDIVTDSRGYKINTVETQKFIENQGNKIIDETINTLEGRKRLAAQFKQEDPWLTNAEIDDLVETRIAETKAAVTHNEPRYWNDIRTDPSLADDRVKRYWFNEIFPYNNAYYSSKNRYYPTVKSSPNHIPLTQVDDSNKFIDPKFSPGSITLGRRNEKNLATLDHEIGHAIGHYGELPLDKKLVELIKPKSIPDYLWELATIFNRNDRNYFLKSFNEPYAFLRESRRKMLDNNIINSAYEKIDVDKLLKQRLKNNKDERLIRLAPPWKWKKLAELYNEAPAVLPVVGATGAAATIGANQMMQPVSENRKGGLVNPYLK